MGSAGIYGDKNPKKTTSEMALKFLRNLKLNSAKYVPLYCEIFKVDSLVLCL